jgi:hypothetical protein
MEVVMVSAGGEINDHCQLLLLLAGDGHGTGPSLSLTSTSCVMGWTVL